MAYVNSNTNFVSVKGDKAVVQVAFNIPVGGPNGIGGVTVDGSVSDYEVKTDKRKSFTFDECNGNRYFCPGKYQYAEGNKQSYGGNQS